MTIRSTIVLFLLLLLSTIACAQTSNDKAIKNFESYFNVFKSAYPADKNTYSFKNYGELNEIKELPEELKMMAEYDTSNFYSVYVYHIKHLRDTLIKISTLTLDGEIKDIYSKFKQSVLDGETHGKFNYKEDSLYSQKLKKLLKNTSPPKVGFYQSAKIITMSPNRQMKENKILIKFTNNLEAISFYLLDE